jgi:hypothetical protein
MKPEHREFWLDALDDKPVDWITLYKDYQSAVEWPTVSYLEQLIGCFPSAKVILTLRDPESWYESAIATIFPGLEASAHNPNLIKRTRSEMQRRLILEKTFGERYRDRDYAIGVYQKHIRDVIDMVPSSRLLQYRIMDGWSPLCAFLGVAVPREPFPHRNERASFLAGYPDWLKEYLRNDNR